MYLQKPDVDSSSLTSRCNGQHLMDDLIHYGGSGLGKIDTGGICRPKCRMTLEPRKDGRLRLEDGGWVAKNEIW